MSSGVLIESLFDTDYRSSRFEVEDAYDLLSAKVQPLEWLVDGLLPHPSTQLIAGDGGTFKSWFTQSIAIAIGAGVPAFGEVPVPKQRNVLYVQSESSKRGLQERLRSLVAGYGVSEFSLRDHLKFVRPRSFKLDRKEDTDELVTGLIKPMKVDVVIFDALVDLHSRDENEIAMNEVMLFTRQLRDRHGVSSIVLHHSPKHGSGNDGSGNGGSGKGGSGRSRGSSAIWNSMDGRWGIQSKDGWSVVQSPYHKELPPRSGFRYRVTTTGVEFELLDGQTTPAEKTYWTEKEFLARFRKRGPFGYKEVVELTGYSDSATRRYLDKLVGKRKLIELDRVKVGKVWQRRFRVAEGA